MFNFFKKNKEEKKEKEEKKFHDHESLYAPKDYIKSRRLIEKLNKKTI